MKLNLVVLRARDIEQVGSFYSALGCAFVRHAHGSGPEHLACERDGFVFEIYPLVGDDASPSEKVRIGFEVDSVTELLERVDASGLGRIVQPAKQSPWGLRAVVEDPAGHKVELVERGA